MAGLGRPENLINGLSKIAGVAGIVATAVSFYAWAIAAMIAIMDLMTPDDGMSPELGKALFNIKTQLQGLEQIQRADQMIGIHSEFDGRIDLMHGLVNRLLVEKPVGSVRRQLVADMRAILDDLAVPLSRLRDQSWTTTYDTEAYKGRGFAAGLLVFERSDGTLTPVRVPGPGDGLRLPARRSDAALRSHDLRRTRTSGDAMVSVGRRLRGPAQENG